MSFFRRAPLRSKIQQNMGAGRSKSDAAQKIQLEKQFELLQKTASSLKSQTSEFKYNLEDVSESLTEQIEELEILMGDTNSTNLALKRQADKDKKLIEALKTKLRKAKARLARQQQFVKGSRDLLKKLKLEESESDGSDEEIEDGILFDLVMNLSGSSQEEEEEAQLNDTEPIKPPSTADKSKKANSASCGCASQASTNSDSSESETY